MDGVARSGVPDPADGRAKCATDGRAKWEGCQRGRASAPDTSVNVNSNAIPSDATGQLALDMTVTPGPLMTVVNDPLRPESTDSMPVGVGRRIGRFVSAGWRCGAALDIAPWRRYATTAVENPGEARDGKLPHSPRSPGPIHGRYFGRQGDERSGGGRGGGGMGRGQCSGGRRPWRGRASNLSPVHRSRRTRSAR